ncbi:MAG: hypothetical protein FJY83_10045 [Candidatus Aminicenantes bacterium]|nr:hypothetical protein [Candidatus Aminicenantes bacterium]
MQKKPEELRPDLNISEASGAFTAEGRVLTWISIPSDMAAEQQACLIPVVVELAETARLAGLPAFDQVLIEGAERKILLARVQRDGSFLALVGGKSLDIGPAFLKMKQAAAALENAPKEP